MIRYIVLLIVLIAVAFPAQASGFSMIRDTETEDYLYELSNPIFKAAGLSPNSVKIHLINDNGINAFVAGGQNLFINTGLILSAENPDVLRGVIAHEVGHIRAGHLLYKKQSMDDIMLQTTLGYVLGIASAVAGGGAESAAFFIAGGQHLAQQQYLQQSRGLEQQADQAALELLEETGSSPAGLLELMKMLGEQQKMNFGDINPYMVTHPLSQSRVTHVQAYLAQNPQANVPYDDAIMRKHQYVRAKLLGFLDNPAEYVKRNTIRGDYGQQAYRYGKVVALHRLGDLKAAQKIMDELLLEEPNNPYFYELKGQVYYEHGYLPESIEAYKKSLELHSRAPLVHYGLGLAYLGSRDYDKAANALLIATTMEPKNASAWYQLGIAYGRSKQLGESYIALADFAVLRQNAADANRYLELAKPHIKDNSVLLLREKDLRAALETLNK